jgi:two-component system sensor histidine kinase YesM
VIVIPYILFIPRLLLIVNSMYGNIYIGFGRGINNAFVHGLESKEGDGIIKIIISEKERMMIRVTDNGLGIEGDRLEHIHNLLENYDSCEHKSIGLSNVNQRIKLYYGEKYGLNIESCLNKGTKVKIILPDFHVNKGDISNAKSIIG